MTDRTQPMLRVVELQRHFDVSPPLLTRTLAGVGRSVVRAVDGVSFDIEAGETFSLVGESGCGKSTVARLVVGLHQPSSGTINFEGVDLSTRPARAVHPEKQRRMQMIFQDPFASLNPRWQVGNIIAEPLKFRRLLTGRAAIAGRVGDLLHQVGLAPADAEKFPHEFSGGQRQRISIARALAGEPAFLVCDEPTSALDASVQAQILNLMQDLQQHLGLTYLFISHNLAVVHHVSSMVGVMYLGRLVEWNRKAALFARPLHPYTRMLLDAIPDIQMTGQSRTPVGGEVPSPLDPPPGCAFHPRCQLADARCRAEAPKALPADGGTVACHAVEEGRLPDWRARKLQVSRL